MAKTRILTIRNQARKKWLVNSHISKSPPYGKPFKLSMNILYASSEAVTHQHTTSLCCWKDDIQDDSDNFNMVDENTIVSVCDHISGMFSNYSLVEIPAIITKYYLNESSITNMNVQMFPELNDFREKHPKYFIFAHLNINWFHSKFIEVHEILTFVPE